MGLYRAPAASARVASVAAVNSKCFHPESFARIRTPPCVPCSCFVLRSVATRRRPRIGRGGGRPVGRYPNGGRSFGGGGRRPRYKRRGPRESRTEPTDTRASTCASWLVGLEARTHGHGQHRQRSEGVHDLLEHEISFRSGRCPMGRVSAACTGHRPRAPTWPTPLPCTAGASTL